jgi:hypothetical protein
MSSKKEQLLSFLDFIFSHPKYQKQLTEILFDLSLTKQDIIQAFLYYNLEVNSKDGNEIYRPLSNRVVLHIHNLIDNSWHIERQQTVIDLIKIANPMTIVDIGFGVPGKYVQKLMFDRKETKITFCDIYDSAFRFAEKLLPYWNKNWRKQITFKKTDMDIKEYIGDFDLYLIQDAIEHTVDPTTYLAKHVKLSPGHSKFIISLPIGPIFPRHYMAWHSDKQAREWIENCGLLIKQQKAVFVNPVVDLFADQIAPDYHDLYTLCVKR